MISPAILIQHKRDGKELSDAEIRYFIEGLSNGEVADYQASAFLMATYFRGMTLAETVSLTRAMTDSGDKFDLSQIQGVKVDKHSTGGVGDKVSLILAPLAAACGVPVPMMAGRGLGHTGGTIDKLEAIPGYKVNLPYSEFTKILGTVGCSIIGQSQTIAPADRKLYALRDVTGTVECNPLICGSILSKKAAEGAQALVLDIKVGNGAFMKKVTHARKLARDLIQVGKRLGLECRAVLSQMEQPLGCTVGNTLEVIESIAVLRNTKPFAELETSSIDLRELTVHLCAHMLELGKVVKRFQDGRKLAIEKLADGSAWQRFRQMVQSHGGSLNAIDDPSKLTLSRKTHVIKAHKRGFIVGMDTQGIGQLLIELKGGRKKTTDVIDYGTGFIFLKKIGSAVKSGDPVAVVYAPETASEKQIKDFEDSFQTLIHISLQRKGAPKLILDPHVK